MIMNKKLIYVIVLFTVFSGSCFAQNISKKDLKEEQRRINDQKIENMINKKEFVFVAQIALPQGYRSINLTTSPNYIKFFPDLIDSDLPFFGRAYSAAGYGDIGGMKFKGVPENYSFSKVKKGYEITATVNNDAHSYRITLSVGPEGSGTLTITSDYRSPISYEGDIVLS
jgi:hypothetical protein